MRRTLPALGALTVFGSTANAEESGSAVIPCIDTHVHFYDPTRSQGVPWPPKNLETLYRPHLPDNFRAATRGLGVAGVVVIEASEWVEDNQWILDLAKNDPLITGFIGHLEPAQPEFARNLKRFAKNPIFRGVRFHQDVLTKCLGQPSFESDIKALADLHLTLDVVGGPGLLQLIPRLVKLAPGLRIVIDHLPFRDWPLEPATIRNSVRNVSQLPHVYAKISDVLRRVDGRLLADPPTYFSMLDMLWSEFGADRVIYGSNWPVSDLVAPYTAVHDTVSTWIARKGAAAQEKFFWKNSLAAYNWQLRGAAALLLKK